MFRRIRNVVMALAIAGGLTFGLLGNCLPGGPDGPVLVETL